MKDYIITVRHKMIFSLYKNSKFRIIARGEDEAAKIVKNHPLFPPDGEVVRVREAAYKKKINP